MEQLALVNNEVKEIQQSLVRVKESFFIIGKNLKMMSMKLNDDIDVFQVAEELFGFKKSSTYNYIQVYERFGTDSDKYKDYSISQLTEMLPMDETKLLSVKPELTVKELRAIKKFNNSNIDDPLRKAIFLIFWKDRIEKINLYYVDAAYLKSKLEHIKYAHLGINYNNKRYALYYSFKIDGLELEYKTLAVADSQYIEMSYHQLTKALNQLIDNGSLVLPMMLDQELAEIFDQDTYEDDNHDNDIPITEDIQTFQTSGKNDSTLSLQDQESNQEISNVYNDLCGNYPFTKQPGLDTEISAVIDALRTSSPMPTITLTLEQYQFFLREHEIALYETNEDSTEFIQRYRDFVEGGATIDTMAQYVQRLDSLKALIAEKDEQLKRLDNRASAMHDNFWHMIDFATQTILHGPNIISNDKRNEYRQYLEALELAQGGKQNAS